MPIFALDDSLAFPPPELATPEGLLAVGGDCRPERLILAYSMGIFPWPVEGYPLLWHSPPERFLLSSSGLKVSRSLRQRMRKRPYELTMDTAFPEVIEACAEVPRPGQDGTWITDEMLDGYCTLHEMGLAHSVEAWLDGELVGGLYGVSLGSAFFGESMFAYASDASKVAFVALVRQLERWRIGLIDCQVYTDHLARFGAANVDRSEFLGSLRMALTDPTRRGMWDFDEDEAARRSS